MNHTRTRKTVRSLLVWLLMLTMVFSLLPMAAFADGVGSGVQPADIVDVDAPESGETGETGENTGDTDPSAPTGDAHVTITDGDEAEPEADTQAADYGTITVIACSDFQHNDGDAAGAETVKAILAAMKNNGITSADGFICAGDYVSPGMSDTAEQTQGHITALKNAVEEMYGTGLNEVYVQGNHDRNAQGTGGLTGPGAHEYNGYIVYVIDEDDYMWYNDNEKRVKQTAANLESYLDGRVNALDSRPIFVVAHLPLHYSMRTYNDGDGQYAGYIFDVLNSAAADGLNIFYLFGHDHSNGWDDYLGGSSVYLGVDKSINIATSKYTWESKTLNFTYMNAGYVGYYAQQNTGAETTLTMTAFQISNGAVTISRYDANGLHNLKSAGVTNSWKDEQANGKYDPDTTVVESPKAVLLTTPAAKPYLSVESTVIDLAGTKSATVTANNFAPTEWTSSDPAIATVENGLVTFTGKVGEVTITASSAETSVSVKLTVKDSSVAPLDRTYTLVTDESEIVSGGRYLLVYDGVADTGGNKTYDTRFVLPKIIQGGTSNSYRIGFDVETTTAAGSDTISGDEYEAYEWTLTGSSGNWLLGNSEGRYVKLLGTLYKGIITTFAETGSSFALAKSGENFTFSTTLPYTGAAVLNYNSRALINGYENTPAPFRIYKLTSGGTSTNEKTIVLTVGQTKSDTISGGNYTDYESSADGIANITLSGKDAQIGDVSYVDAQVRVKDAATDTDWKKTGTYKNFNGNYNEVYAKYYTDTGTYQLVYTTTGDLNGTKDYFAATKESGTGEVYIPLITSSTPASTTVVFTGTSAGTTIVKVGGVTYTVIVNEKPAENEYPEYPDEGSVRVEKTGQGVDFQNTGVAKVELSTVGVPMKKGVDVILMLDTSSSMGAELNNSTSTRIEVLRKSVKNMLATFNEKDGTTGTVPDIRVAIADFNGYEYSSNSPLYLETDDHMPSGSIRSGIQSNTTVFTGNASYTAKAFVSATEYSTAASRENLAESIEVRNGTNYDAAFYYTYQLAESITEENKANGVDRDLYVVFMSDGAPFQYNFYSAQSGYNDTDVYWKNWLDGTANNATGTHSYFYNGDGNKNRWAEAVKGDTSSTYTVIDKTKNTSGSNAYLTDVPGLGAKMYAIGFCLEQDGVVTVESQRNLLGKIATDSSYLYITDTAAGLDDAFQQIASNVKKAGQNAVFTDKLGEAYDLKLGDFYNNNNEKVGSSQITVSTYELYKKSEVGKTVGGVKVTENMVGTRKSNTPKTIQETVTFNAGGTEAYSDKVGSTTNILTDGKINAKLFTYDLTTETFYWNVGDITEDEQVLTYYVYLTGSMEGTRGAGSYPTNESAVLNYKNWLDHDAHKDTVSPVMPWKSANVSYAFYLVDGNGSPIANQTTGAIGSFTNAVKITQPVVYSEVLLNSEKDIDAKVVAQDALPAGYELFDETAAYEIKVSSGTGGGSWKITNGKAVATTYVAQYDANNSAAVTNKVDSNDVNEGKNDYTHTVVWFAVKYVIGCVPDSVVIDFGLPVDISVLGNDILGENATVAGISGSVEGLPTTGTSALATGFGTTVEGKFGSAAVNGSKVRYTPSGMTMNEVETFAYSAQASLASDNNYYYSTVTVIPAANIYYEDSFVKFSDGWEQIGQTEDGITQQEDRPGQFSLAAYDANNVYGYDAAYKKCSAYSLGSAMKTTVTKATNSNPPTATFTFTGTGFDLISLTSKDTGAIFVDVVGEGNDVNENWIVNTYYGYTRTDAGYNKYTWTMDDNGNWHSTREVIDTLPAGAVLDGIPAKAGDVTYSKNYIWEVTTDTDNALYQIPVIRAQGLGYGKYTVTVTPMYSSMQDPNKDGSYDFYLDAVRIYDPAGENPDGTIGDAYKADNEGWPQIIELRNQLIDFGALSVDTTTSAKGIVFVDGNGAAELGDYTNFGPNNEVYLAANQAIAFKLNVANSSNIAAIQIAAKAPTGTAKAQVNNGTVTEIATATEMYYTITHRIIWPNNGQESGVIVVANVGENILSLTNIKITYKTDPNGSTAAALVDDAVVSEAPAVLMSMLGIEPPQEKTFEPDSVSMSWNKVRQGGRAVLTVKTSEDVTAISVNGGEPIESYQTRTERTGWSWNAKRVTYHVFTYTVDNAQTADYEIVAINSDGAVSEKTYTTTLVVKSASPIRDWLDDLFGRWF